DPVHLVAHPRAAIAPGYQGHQETCQSVVEGGRWRSDETGCSAADCDRDASQLVPEILGDGVSRISGEQFVTAVTRQRHGDLLAGQLGNEKGRDLRGV